MLNRGIKNRESAAGAAGRPAPGMHMCCIYESEDEHRKVICEFIRQGFEQGEKVIYIADAGTARKMLEAFEKDGLEVYSRMSKGQLLILASRGSYIRGGAFDPAAMLGMLEKETETAVCEGYPALRVAGEMDWALSGAPGAERLVEYESGLNSFFPGSKCLALCLYDKKKFSPETLLGILRAHPAAVIKKRVYGNYYAAFGGSSGKESAESALESLLENIERRAMKPAGVGL